MRQLTQDREALREAWEKRSKQLKQCSELQQFLRDAEQVDSATGAQEAFLSNDDLGVSETCVLLHVYHLEAAFHLHCQAKSNYIKASIL